MSALRRLRAWRSAASGRKVYLGRGLVAMADGERSVMASGYTTEHAASVALETWGAA